VAQTKLYPPPLKLSPQNKIKHQWKDIKKHEWYGGDAKTLGNIDDEHETIKIGWPPWLFISHLTQLFTQDRTLSLIANLPLDTVQVGQTTQNPLVSATKCTISTGDQAVYTLQPSRPIGSTQETVPPNSCQVSAIKTNQQAVD
jgi:hypothetical protein